ncbi:MAG: hypothetical protein ACXVPN_06015 [Bacteroidia bacterium]
MKKWMFFTLLLGYACKGISQSEEGKATLGVEQDVLPYVLKGYIGTLWMGFDNYRYRVSYAQAATPSFTHGKGISKDVVNALGLSFEFFRNKDFKGLWFGPGLGYWSNNIITAGGDKISNQSVVFSLGGGYNYFLNKFLYISPWVALHTRVSGTQSIYVSDHTYNPAIFTPEVSFKIGVKF